MPFKSQRGGKAKEKCRLYCGKHQQIRNKITTAKESVRKKRENKEKSFTNRHLEGKLNEKHLEKENSSDSAFKYNSSIICCMKIPREKWQPKESRF